MYYYSLRIDISEKCQIIEISDILGIAPNCPSVDWGFEILQEDNDIPVNYIDVFLSILEGKYKELEKNNIFRKDISIWVLYEYSEQCNIEFTPNELYKIGEAEITFCISCWQK